MSIDWIRKSYNVPAKIGDRVEYRGDKSARQGMITGVRGPHLLIRLDGDQEAMPYHPTWKIAYLDPAPPSQGETS